MSDKRATAVVTSYASLATVVAVASAADVSSAVAYRKNADHVMMTAQVSSAVVVDSAHLLVVVVCSHHVAAGVSNNGPDVGQFCSHW